MSNCEHLNHPEHWPGDAGAVREAARTGTAARWRCPDCGEEWTWRYTYDGFNAFARTQRQHDGQLRMVDEARG